MASLEYKVPRLLWENLESVLLAQSRKYICELAKRLNVSEKELLKKVLPASDSLKVLIFDSACESNQCKAYIQQNELTVFCKKPVAYQSEFCLTHRENRITVINNTVSEPIQKVKDINNVQPMWSVHNTLINSNGGVVGKINKNDGKIKIFVIE